MNSSLTRILAGLIIASAAAANAQVCPGDDNLGNSTFATAESVNLTSESSDYISLALVAPLDRDVFTFSLGAGQRVDVNAIFGGSSNDLDLEFFNSNQQSLFVVSSQGNSESLSWTNTTGSTQNYFVAAVKDQSAGCIEYNISFSLFCEPDDPFEPNDTCDVATRVTPASYPFLGLRVFDVDEDHYSFDLLPGETLDVGIAFTHQTADLDIQLFDFDGSACGALLGQGTTITDNESVTYANTTGAPQSVVLRVYVFNFDGPCNDYSLSWSFGQGVCSTPDGFEPNQSICTAPTAFGIFQGLEVSPTDEDHYQLITPDAGNRVSFTIDFDGAASDIDLELFEYGPDCNAPVLVDTSVSVTGRETVSAIVPNSSATYVVRVYLFSGACGAYDMISSFGAASDISDVICEVALNSEGRPGFTRVAGSSSVVDNDVTVFVSDAPPAQFGIFLVSRAPAFVPGAGGSAGILCLGGDIGRFVASGQVQLTDAQGSASLPISLNLIPQGSSLVQVAPGDRWYFQFWHRDVPTGGAGSNYAGAAKVDFE